MTTQTVPTEDPLQLIRLFTNALLSEGKTDPTPILSRMVTLALAPSGDAPVQTSPVLEPELRHKPTVSKLMDLARQFRQSHPDDYDTAYKALQTALYAALQHTP